MDSTRPTPKVNASPFTIYESAAARNALHRDADRRRREAARIAELDELGDLEITRVTSRPTAR